MECGKYSTPTEKAHKMIAFNEFLRSIRNNEYAGEYEIHQMTKYLNSNIYFFNSTTNDPSSYLLEGAKNNIYLGYIREEKHYVTLLPISPAVPITLRSNQDPERPDNGPKLTGETLNNVDLRQGNKVNQIIHLALLASEGVKSTFITNYLELAKINGMETINIPANMFDNIHYSAHIAGIVGGAKDTHKASGKPNAYKNKLLSTSLPTQKSKKIEEHEKIEEPPSSKKIEEREKIEEPTSSKKIEEHEKIEEPPINKSVANNQNNSKINRYKKSKKRKNLTAESILDPQSQSITSEQPKLIEYRESQDDIITGQLKLTPDIEDHPTSQHDISAHNNSALLILSTEEPSINQSSSLVQNSSSIVAPINTQSPSGHDISLPSLALDLRTRLVYWGLLCA